MNPIEHARHDTVRLAQFIVDNPLLNNTAVPLKVLRARGVPEEGLETVRAVLADPDKMFAAIKAAYVIAADALGKDMHDIENFVASCAANGIKVEAYAPTEGTSLETLRADAVTQLSPERADEFIEAMKRREVIQIELPSGLQKFIIWGTDAARADLEATLRHFTTAATLH